MKTNGKIAKYLDVWRNFANGSINRQIFTATIIIGLFTGLSKFVSVGKELVVAWRFGTGDQIDSFVMTMVMPYFVTTVVANSLSTALIPTYIKVREESPKAAQQLLSGIMTRAIGLLIVISIAVPVTAPLYLPIMASGFTDTKLELTNRLLWMVSPSILLSGIINILGGIMNAGEKFALAAFSPVLSPLASVAMLFIFPAWGIYALAAGLICGTFIEMIVLGIALQRQGIDLRPRWLKSDTNLDVVIKEYFPVMVGSFLMCSTNLVDQSMAAMLAPGSVAALGYAFRVIALPLSLVTLALGTSVVPYFSKTIAQKDWRKINHTFKYYLRLIFITTIPLTLLFVFASKLIVQVLFERGSFTVESTQLVSQIQILYALEIPFFVASIFVVRLINSLGINNYLAWGSAINLIANIIGNYVFAKWIGVAGIALSTSCVYLISFVFLYMLTNKHLQKILLENNQIQP
jgi:putative peptidoglycan lipid II flippase